MHSDHCRARVFNKTTFCFDSDIDDPAIFSNKVIFMVIIFLTVAFFLATGKPQISCVFRKRQSLYQYLVLLNFSFISCSLTEVFHAGGTTHLRRSWSPALRQRPFSLLRNLAFVRLCRRHCGECVERNWFRLFQLSCRPGSFDPFKLQAAGFYCFLTTYD